MSMDGIKTKKKHRLIKKKIPKEEKILL